MHPTRRRTAAVVAMVTLPTLLLSVLASGCSGGKDDGAAPVATSKERTTTTVGSSQPSPTDPGSSGGGLDDLGDLPGIDALGDCADVVLAYTQLAVTVIQGDQAAAKVDEVMAKVRTKVPAELQDDLQKVGDGYAAAAKAGLLNAGKVLDDPEFRKANKAVGDYLEQACGAKAGN